ncbi:MAG TPA: hypothetical protein ENN36_00855 [Candidatus Bathyarchaeota archaeon]|nr:hypothetical protein [Candidatus Bathyarchaeota archaeon]
MNGGPLPGSRRGWIAAATLIVLAFLFYYLHMFQVLLDFYDSALYSIQPNFHPIEPVAEYSLCNFEELEFLSSLEVRIDSPHHIASFGRRWIYLTVRNNGDRSIEDVEFWLVLDKDQSIISWAMPFLFEDATLQRSAHFARLDPGAEVSGRIPVFAARKIEGGVQVRARLQNCIAQVMSDSQPFSFPLNFSRAKFLAHSLVENLLLPPWSNGFIVAVVLVACHFAERREKEEGVKLIGSALPKNLPLSSKTDLDNGVPPDEFLAMLEGLDRNSGITVAKLGESRGWEICDPVHHLTYLVVKEKEQAAQEQEKEKESTVLKVYKGRHWYFSLAVLFVDSLKSLIVVWGFVLILISIPWLWYWEGPLDFKDPSFWNGFRLVLPFVLLLLYRKWSFVRSMVDGVKKIVICVLDRVLSERIDKNIKSLVCKVFLYILLFGSVRLYYFYIVRPRSDIYAFVEIVLLIVLFWQPLQELRNCLDKKALQWNLPSFK